jgi:hypothetical protein
MKTRAAAAILSGAAAVAITWNDTCACAVKACDISTVKNALVKSRSVPFAVPFTHFKEPISIADFIWCAINPASSLWLRRLSVVPYGSDISVSVALRCIPVIPRYICEPALCLLAYVMYLLSHVIRVNLRYMSASPRYMPVSLRYIPVSPAFHIRFLMLYMLACVICLLA